MDIHFDRVGIDQQPAPGWHTFPDNRLGYCTVQGDAFALHFFKVGQVTDANHEELRCKSERLAYACFAEMGWPGPSRPQNRAPTPPASPSAPELTPKELEQLIALYTTDEQASATS